MSVMTSWKGWNDLERTSGGVLRSAPRFNLSLIPSFLFPTKSGINPNTSKSLKSYKHCKLKLSTQLLKIEGKAKMWPELCRLTTSSVRTRKQDATPILLKEGQIQDIVYFCRIKWLSPRRERKMTVRPQEAPVLTQNALKHWVVTNSRINQWDLYLSSESLEISR